MEGTFTSSLHLIDYDTPTLTLCTSFFTGIFFACSFLLTTDRLFVCIKYSRILFTMIRLYNIPRLGLNILA